MKTREEALKYGLSFEGAFQDAPFHDDNWQLVRYAGNKKAFLWTYEKDGYINLNVKVDPEKAFFWRDMYKSVVPGYHQNKDNWNTVVLDGSIPDKDIKMMIAESYDLVSYSPSKKIYEAVKKIPYGKVATYGQVAEVAGNKKMSRAVGNALHKNPDPDHIPCFRVVNSKGELSGEFAFGGAGRQAELLEAEGIVVKDGRVDLTKYQWDSGYSVERISKYEKMMDKAKEEMVKPDAAKSKKLKGLVKDLEEYYLSYEWKKDFEADEEGLLPGELKRGVLSEDGIYDLLDEYKELINGAII